MPRVVTSYASPAQFDRVHFSRGYRGSLHTYRYELSGVLDGGQIAQADWATYSPWVTKLGSPTISGSQCLVPVELIYDGATQMRCLATLTDGRVFSQVFRVEVPCSPWFQCDVAPTAGPFCVSVTATLCPLAESTATVTAASNGIGEWNVDLVFALSGQSGPPAVLANLSGTVDDTAGNEFDVIWNLISEVAGTYTYRANVPETVQPGLNTLPFVSTAVFSYTEGACQVTVAATNDVS